MTRSHAVGWITGHNARAHGVRPRPVPTARTKRSPGSTRSCAAQVFSIEDVLLLAKRYRGARGLKALRTALPLVDGGAASPKETWLRLLYIDAGLPRPTTQIPIVEGRGQLVRWSDMGWEEYMVVSEYDGDQHRTNRRQYIKDIRALRRARELGWIVDQVIKEDQPTDIVERARTALMSRGWRP